MTERSVFSVAQINEYLKMLLDGDRVLSNVFVRGEISNFKQQLSSGHCYFTIKDEQSQLRSVMFRFQAARLAFRPADGMRVIAHGRVSVYEASGQYQLYVDDIIPDGAGSLALQFEQLKRRLEGEGLFDASRKKPLPYMPRRVGVITSPTGAAVHDIQTILARRFPATEMILFPAQVQGIEAPAQLIAGLELFQSVDLVDVIILGRGGGSAEDLWAFNDEALARAVAACRLPVISAVGHESDFTICDFAADRRAPTPSAAAELAVPDVREILSGLSGMATRMKNAVNGRMEEERYKLQRVMHSRPFAHPERLFDSYRMKLGMKEELLCRTMDRALLQKKQEIGSVAGRLEALNPLAVLARGYAAVSREGKALPSVKEVECGDKIDIRMTDGHLLAEIIQKTEDHNG